MNYDDQTSGGFGFESPVSEEDQKDIRWYLEVYAALYTTDVDDQRAEKIATKLPEWGKKLFNSVFGNDSAYNLFRQFQSQREQNRLMTISSSHPAILSLPWELLHNPEGAFLFHDNPRTSVRRHWAGLDDRHKVFEVKAKDRLHLLFVVSRPQGAAFLDPRTDCVGTGSTRAG
ncbi:MAG: hypothetical protein GY749_19650 [Desulfobacteraceae bacterium]|nr:hypothetical protein [Desulfobacteraceae bacterium]